MGADSAVRRCILQARSPCKKRACFRNTARMQTCIKFAGVQSIKGQCFTPAVFCPHTWTGLCDGLYGLSELSGSEVCLSTGDLVKVIDIEFQSVTCEDISTKETSQLPLDYKGGFLIVPEEMPFCSIEEMVDHIPTEPEASDTFSFTCRHDLVLDGRTLVAGEPLVLLSIEHHGDDEEGLARCSLIGQTAEEVLVPLSYRGEFYENQSSHSYNLREIMSTPRLRGRHYRHTRTTRCGGPLLLKPVHQVKAIMHLRKNVVQFPSSLEVDVIDVTESSQDVVFVTPLTLAEVAAKPADVFPNMAEILDTPEGTRALFRCRWLPSLRSGRFLVIHGAGDPTVVLASTFKGKKERRHFLLSHCYAGGLRRRPRDFNSVYELYAASCRALPDRGGAPLRVTVATHCESTEEELASLSVGDQLEVLRHEQVKVGGRDDDDGGEKQEMEVLVCRRTLEADDEDEDEEDEEEEGGRRREESEEIYLPMYLQGHFVEKIADNKRYSLADLCKRFPLPLDVKVGRRDPAMADDPLPGFSALRLEEVAAEPTVVVSLADEPDLLFELPVRWISMSVSFTSDPLPWSGGAPPVWRRETVTEVTDNFYFEFRKAAQPEAGAPPPRPPKRSTSTQTAPKNPTPRTASKASHSPAPNPKSMSLPHSLDKLSLRSPLPPPPVELCDGPPPLIPRKPSSSSSGSTQPNMYVQTPKKTKKKKGKRDSGSDHDYEEMIDIVKNAQESVMFY
ncbi:hypothetical protein AGOR_G00120430 [Albula goreensis]|uniref:CABIT domain-containing protein n=1 Tax=Albula goreensis TaxID=1534307 RepID=A0A8T3DDJ4_9TELE|nr:hypothetical protein AGOR_G00120430 [Albula goreensis]